jgi:hypothetical protein
MTIGETPSIDPVLTPRIKEVFKTLATTGVASLIGADADVRLSTHIQAGIEAQLSRKEPHRATLVVSTPAPCTPECNPLPKHVDTPDDAAFSAETTGISQLDKGTVSEHVASSRTLTYTVLNRVQILQDLAASGVAITHIYPYDHSRNQAQMNIFREKVLSPDAPRNTHVLQGISAKEFPKDLIGAIATSSESVHFAILATQANTGSEGKQHILYLGDNSVPVVEDRMDYVHRTIDHLKSKGFTSEDISTPKPSDT